jgi:hypothetical protein
MWQGSCFHSKHSNVLKSIAVNDYNKKKLVILKKQTSFTNGSEYGYGYE